MTKTVFSNLEAIPELVPAALWLPEDRPELLVPKREVHSVETTTPREVGYAFYTNSFGLGPETDVLKIYEEAGIPTERLMVERWGNHIGRAVMRVMLDPDRLAPVHMVDVYKNELAFARFTDPGEEYFFEEFVASHGVLDRD